MWEPATLVAQALAHHGSQPPQGLTWDNRAQIRLLVSISLTIHTTWSLHHSFANGFLKVEGTPSVFSQNIKTQKTKTKNWIHIWSEWCYICQDFPSQWYRASSVLPSAVTWAGFIDTHYSMRGSRVGIISHVIDAKRRKLKSLSKGKHLLNGRGKANAESLD